MGVGIDLWVYTPTLQALITSRKYNGPMSAPPFELPSLVLEWQKLGPAKSAGEETIAPAPECQSGPLPAIGGARLRSHLGVEGI
jgi:hypothetical protein